MPFSISEARFQQIAQSAVEDLATRVQVGVADITPEARTEVETRLREALEVETTRVVGDVSIEQARRAVAQQGHIAQVGVRVSDQLAVGLDIASLITEDAKYRQIVEKNARMLRMKHDALVDAGFTPDQAFRLVEVEFMGKASARAR